MIFPPQNDEIYRKIIETKGAIVSEYPMGTSPESERFRQRNRIVSGLSLGVLIVEAAEKSGTGITARFAREQDKDLFCIPNSIENTKGIGTNNQIRKGAKLVLEPRDILEKYGIYKKNIISLKDLDESEKISIYKLNEINEEYRAIYEILYRPLSVNEISIKTGTSLTEVYSKLFMMEMEGLIIQEENKYRINLFD